MTNTFHPDFLGRTFEDNDATILAALAPVVAGMVRGAVTSEHSASNRDAFEDTLKEYMAAYGEHLFKLDHRAFIVALNKAFVIMESRAEKD